MIKSLNGTIPKNRGPFVGFVLKKSGTECPSPRGRFVTDTLGPRNASSWGRFVQGHIVSVPSFILLWIRLKKNARLAVAATTIIFFCLLTVYHLLWQSSEFQVIFSTVYSYLISFFTYRYLIALIESLTDISRIRFN
jgi:hypothetical protein